MAMPVIVLNSLNAVRHTPASLIEMARAFLGSRWQLVFKIILPAASPVIFAGLRLGCAAGFIGVILGPVLLALGFALGRAWVSTQDVLTTGLVAADGAAVSPAAPIPPATDA